MTGSDVGTTMCISGSDPSIVPVPPRQILHQHPYSNETKQFYSPSKPQYVSPLYRHPEPASSLVDLCSAPLDSMSMQPSLPPIRELEVVGSPLHRASQPQMQSPSHSVLDLCSPPLDSVNLQHSRHIRDLGNRVNSPLRRGSTAPGGHGVLSQVMQHGIPPLKLDDFHPMQQSRPPVSRTINQNFSGRASTPSGLPSLKLDDFNMGFAGGSSYNGGTEWMDLMSDLQPCESDESSVLPVVVDAWENDFTLPRDLRVRGSCEGEDITALAMQRVGGAQQDEYEMQHRLRTLLGHTSAGAVQDEPSFDASAHTEHTQKEAEAEERETESDYSGGLEKDHGVHLVHLLLECAGFIEKNHNSTVATLRRLRDLSSPFGDAMQRVAAYFCDALTKRVARAKGENDPSAASTVEGHIKESLIASQVLNEACPYMKFAHLTANQAILEAVEGCDSVHIVDFGVAHGVQWAAFLQALGSRPRKARPPPRVRITGISGGNSGSDTSHSLHATGKRLQSFAEILNVQLEFCVVVASMEEFNPETIRVDADEKLLVNFMLQLHQLLGDGGSQPVHQLLKLVASLNPILVILTEYDAALNGPEFQPRFMDALHFYCAVFDSLDASMPRDCQDRLTVESSYFAKEIENIVAYEGVERTERHESTEHWVNIMHSSGFLSVPLSHYAHSQAQQLLWQYCESFRLLKSSGCISLTWQDRSLVTVSAWKCS